VTTTSTKQFVKAVQGIRTLPEKTAKTAVKLNAATAVSNADKSVKSATNSQATLRNAGATVRAGTRVVGKRGAKLTVTSKLENNGTQAFIKAVGPWQLVENDTKQHFIGPAGVTKTAKGSRSGRASARARVGRAKALRTPYGIKRWVYVRGTKGKHPWKRAFDKTAAEAPKALAQASKIEVAKVVR
jgi:hypothetical protein